MAHTSDKRNEHDDPAEAGPDVSGMIEIKNCGLDRSCVEMVSPRWDNGGRGDGLYIEGGKDPLRVTPPNYHVNRLLLFSFRFTRSKPGILLPRGLIALQKQRDEHKGLI